MFYTPKKIGAQRRIPKIEMPPFRLIENFINKIGNYKEDISSGYFAIRIDHF